MSIQVQVLSVTSETKPTAKGSYQMLEVAYKNLSDGGKVGAKKLMSFSKTEGTTFRVLADAKALEVYDVELVKGEKYWEWTTATRNHGGGATSGSTSGSGSTTGTSARTGTASYATAKPTYETPEERAKKQIFIVRQSSLSNAIELLTTGAKVPPHVDDIIATAERFEAFVFGSGEAEDTARKDVGSIEDMEDSIPY